MNMSGRMGEDRGNKTGSPFKSVAINGYCREHETGYQINAKLNK